MSRRNVFIAASQWGGLRFPVMQRTEEVALRVVDASSICIKANSGAPSGASEYRGYGSNQRDRFQYHQSHWLTQTNELLHL